MPYFTGIDSELRYFLKLRCGLHVRNQPWEGEGENGENGERGRGGDGENGERGRMGRMGRMGEGERGETIEIYNLN
ncbi:hypothetical protein [Microcoleus sp. PH2017_14_LAR_D_A]|uniref:hypothetical protein n=1 Tax=Microcoleus sp. PH2017_14_LAR_D_A TaxID=2798825 RepID=UPI001D2EBDEA|nr:hypothetical protein [Microcoleus sp. PH2017_14_LAR_D_A]MCC3486153.1 hypothetical protein [Microcoleus sp. PH2017_14_LAR_D_A]